MRGKASGLFKRMAGALASGKDTQLVWEPAGGYPRLLLFDARVLAGRTGVYAVWHLGVRPQWLRVGFSADLGAAAAVLARTPEIAAFGPHDGPFLSWSFCGAEGAAGIVNFLVNRLNPIVQTQALVCDVPVDPAAPARPCALPPGTKDIQPH